MSEENVTIISSDGHAGALMADYRPYLDPEYRDEFDDFLTEWNEKGSRNFDPPALRARLDAEYVEEWNEKMVVTGRIDGFPDAAVRLREVEREGIAAEVLFPDFGLPFELYSRTLASALGHPPLDEAHRRAAYRAFNRWVADYVSIAPERFAAMGIVSWHDVDDAMADIRALPDLGLRGLVLPEFDLKLPLYHPTYEPVWSLIEELGLVVNSHSGLSSTSNHVIYTPGVPHPACAIRLWVPEAFFFTHNILNHLIWGGVLERHPSIKVTFTEQGSAWVPPTLVEMDYAYEGSYFRTDYKDVIRLRPSEYFARQCYIGSSIFSKAEVAQRHLIGLDKMMLGMDFPHHEGTLVQTTQEYLRATVGDAGVPRDEAHTLLCGNAAKVFGFDLAKLGPVAARIGLTWDDVLTPPSTNLFPRGDVHKPAALHI
ncbi:MAG: amidohydrolase family protein [Microbacteriaceae bacterium]